MSESPDAKRRRRKKTGLRVPSDDVPRRATSESDPRLAVSLAGAFGAQTAVLEESEGEGEQDEQSVALDHLVDGSRAGTGDSVDIAFDDGEELDGAEELDELDELDDEDSDRDSASSSGVVARPVDDAAVAAALAGDIEDVSEAAEELHDGPRTDRIEAVQAPEQEAPLHPVVDDGRATMVMPALSEQDIGWTDAEAGDSAPAADSAPSSPPAGAVPVAVSAEVESPPPLAAAQAGPEDEDDDDFDVPVVEGEPVIDESTDAGAAPVEAQVEAVGGRVEPGDASDSGEMLTDDLIEEYEQGTHDAPAVRAGGGAAATDYARDARAKTVMEPVEELAPSDVVEVEAEAAAAAAPTPASTQAAPPPAPKPAAAPPPAPKPPPAPPRGVAAAQPRSAPRRKGKPWFEEIFDEDYLRTLPFLTPQQTQKQSNFVIEALGISPGDSVLDVGCGYGRHAMELAARGYHVVGLDASLPLLIRGADEAQRRGLTINFVHGDMRELTFESQFDGAYCLFGTFGYFDDETNKKAAHAIARALKPGARFVVEVLNRDYLIADLPSRVWWEGDGCVVLEEVEFNYFSSRIVSNRSVVFDDGRQLEQEISLRAYSLHELGKLLHAAGFRILELSGSMDTKGRFFGNQSRELVVVCERRGSKSAGSDTTPPVTGGDDGELGNGTDGTLPGTGGKSE